MNINEGTRSVAGRYGVIVVRNDDEYSIHRRIFPKIPSRLEAWVDARWRRLPDNCWHLYYNAPYRCPGFLVLAYVRGGRNTTVASLRTGMAVLDEVARMLGLQSIVCETTNPKLTSRVMKYFGYIQHAHQLKGLHYIKRLTTRSE